MSLDGIKTVHRGTSIHSLALLHVYVSSASARRPFCGVYRQQNA